MDGESACPCMPSLGFSHANEADSLYTYLYGRRCTTDVPCAACVLTTRCLLMHKCTWNVVVQRQKRIRNNLFMPVKCVDHIDDTFIYTIQLRLARHVQLYYSEDEARRVERKMPFVSFSSWEKSLTLTEFNQLQPNVKRWATSKNEIATQHSTNRRGERCGATTTTHSYFFAAAAATGFIEMSLLDELITFVRQTNWIELKNGVSHLQSHYFEWNRSRVIWKAMWCECACVCVCPTHWHTQSGSPSAISTQSSVILFRNSVMNVWDSLPSGKRESETQNVWEPKPKFVHQTEKFIEAAHSLETEARGGRLIIDGYSLQVTHT